MESVHLKFKSESFQDQRDSKGVHPKKKYGIFLNMCTHGGECHSSFLSGGGRKSGTRRSVGKDDAALHMDSFVYSFDEPALRKTSLSARDAILKSLAVLTI